jgi:hypothetical protein
MEDDMAKKAEKREPHLRIRIEPKLVARLEKARVKNGNTLTGEIVSRLEESFAVQDKIELFAEAQEKRIEELRSSSDRLREEIAQQRRELDRSQVEQAASNQRFVEEVKRIETSAALVHVLLGKDIASSQAVRRIALLLTLNPDWHASPGRIHKMIEDINAAVEAAAEESKQ